MKMSMFKVNYCCCCCCYYSVAVIIMIVRHIVTTPSKVNMTYDWLTDCLRVWCKKR